MAVKPIHTDKAPAAIGPYSQATVSGSLLFVSGQLGLDPLTGEFAGTDFSSQAKQALRNLGQIVQAGGYEIPNIAAVDVFLTNMGHFAEFNTIYADFFSGHKPARAVVEVSALPKSALVEIKCIAAK